MIIKIAACILGSLMPLFGGVGTTAADSLRRGEVIRLEGSFVEPLQQRDSILIADQIVYGFRMNGVPEGTLLSYPEIAQPFMENMVTVRPWQTDTVKVHKERSTGEKRYDIKSWIVVAPFEEGHYDLPPLFVERLSGNRPADTLLFDPQALDVTTIQIDTATFVPHDIKGQIRYPVTLKEIFPYLLGLYLLLGLIIALVCFLKIRRGRQTGPVYQEPAHIAALRKLDKYRGEKYWEPDRQKQFYSGVTDTLREYMASRYGVGAMEMTTAEIFTELKNADIPEELYAEMKDLFERADFVKFAKYVASKEDNSTVLPQAVRFITETCRVEEETSSDTEGEPKRQEE